MLHSSTCCEPSWFLRRSGGKAVTVRACSKITWPYLSRICSLNYPLRSWREFSNANLSAQLWYRIWTSHRQLPPLDPEDHETASLFSNVNLRNSEWGVTLKCTSLYKYLCICIGRGICTFVNHHYSTTVLRTHWPSGFPSTPWKPSSSLNFPGFLGDIRIDLSSWGE